MVADRLYAILLDVSDSLLASKRPGKQYGLCHSAYARDSGHAGRPWSDDEVADAD